MQSQPKFHNLATYLLIFSAGCIPLKIQMSMYALVAFCLLVIISRIKENNYKILPNNDQLVLILVFLVFFISVLLSEDKKTGWVLLSRSIFLFILPLIFMWYKPSSQEKNLVLKLFIWGCIVASMLCLFRALNKSILNTPTGWIFDSRVLKEPQIDFMTSIVWGGNYFFSADLSAFMHPSYFSLFLLFSICIAILDINILKISKAKTIGLIVFMLLMVYLLSSRAAFLSIFLILGVVSSKLIARLSLIKGVAVLIVIIASFLTMFLINPKLKDLLIKISEQGFTLQPEGRYSFETRLLTWNAATQIIKKDPVLGAGLGDVQNDLMAFYKKNGYVIPYEEEYNAHNQFLETFAGTGVIGFAILIFVLIYPLFVVRKDMLVICFVLLTSFNFLFETMLVRYHGIAFLSFFYCLLIGNYKNAPADER